MTAQLQGFLNFVGHHQTLAIAAAFLVSAGEALPVIGLFSPSTVVLVGIGGLIGLGKASFWPVIGVLVIAIVLAMWFAKVAIGSGLSYLTHLQAASLDWANRRGDRIGYAIERLAAPNHADFRLLVTLYIVLIGAITGFAGLLEATVMKNPGLQFGFGSVEFLQSLRTNWGDAAMVGVAMLGDWLVTSLLGIVGCAVLLIHRRFRLAMGLVLALASTMIFVQGMKLLVHPQRSIDLYSGVDAFSFPSGQATMTATFYGTLGSIAVRGAGATLGTAVAGACVTLIMVVAFSCIYLAAPWPSDVAAGLLFGTGATAAFALAFRGYEVPRRAAIALIAASAATLAIVGSWHIERGFRQTLSLYARPPRPAVALSKPWRDGGWKELPAYRTDLAGETEEPLVLQWRGDAATLQDELMKQGWLMEPVWSLAALNAFARPDTGPANMPVIPKFDDGRFQSLAMIRVGELAGEQGRFVLRAWSQDAIEPNGSNAEIHLGSILFERVDHPLSQLSIPIRADHRTCDGDQLLSSLANTLRVGEILAGPEGTCGGQVVLAW